jgi:hypothetical protein
MIIRDGQEVVIGGMWYIVEGDEEDGWIFVCDQDGGSREVHVGDIDHIYNGPLG